MKSIHVIAQTLAQAWEQALCQCWQEGSEFRTEYDKPGDPSSRDTLAVIHVLKPFDQPRVHRAFPGGLNDLEKYRAEMLYGVHDHWVDPQVNKWEYTYYQRLSEYALPQGQVIDQMAAVVAKLRQASFTRRAQAVTWQAWQDPQFLHPPCLQRLWFRVEDQRLNMVAHMRSNDAYKAAFMNMYAFTEVQAEVAKQLDLPSGEYIHIADSFHIYGSYFQEFAAFLKTLEKRSPEERYFDSDFCREFFIEGLDQLLPEQDMPSAKKVLLRARKKELTRSTEC